MVAPLYNAPTLHTLQMIIVSEHCEHITVIMLMMHVCSSCVSTRHKHYLLQIQML